MAILFPAILSADIKFCVAASLEGAAKAFAKEGAEKISIALSNEIFLDTESQIYEDEAALYALKNGIIKFTIVKNDLFAEMGLKPDRLSSYGFAPLSKRDGYTLLVCGKFFEGLSPRQKAALKSAF